MRIVNLDSNDRVGYDALSYTWGVATLEEKEPASRQIFTTVQRCYPIMCDGKIVLATQNLRSALRRIRQLDRPQMASYFLKEYGRRRQEYVWADALCINQQDIAERSRQVSLMSDIYSRAISVFAYLGEPDEFTDSAIKTMIKLRDLSKTTFGPDALPITLLDSEAMVFDRIGVEPPSVEEWFDWATFLCREWLQRTWVVQEVSLPGEGNVHCFVGSKLFPFGYLTP